MPSSHDRARTAVAVKAVGLHALASLLAQAQQLRPEAIRDARDQELTWA